MKKSITIFSFLLTAAICLSQTTEEEYLYLTFGYQEQLQNGLDDKEGYYWKPVLDEYYTEDKGIPVINRSKQSGLFKFEALMRTGEDHPSALVAIYLEDHKMKKRDGLFIPIPSSKSNPVIIGKANWYLEEELKLDRTTFRNYSIALQRLAIHIAEEQK